MPPRSQTKILDTPWPDPLGPQLTLVDSNGAKDISNDEGVIKIEHPDGSVTIDLDPPEENEDESTEDEFGENLAEGMSDADLADIASTLLDGIDRDEQSRKDWLETRAMGITLLGLKLEKPRADAGTGSAPLEGMSTVRHPLLLEATVAFQATARAELLPAAGPVKVRNDSTTPPVAMLQHTSASQELAASLASKDELAQALETDLNHYLTYTATEYVPDTDRMLFYIGFGGDGFKKVYNCPLRRRPVSESIDAEDLIVSNVATDLQNAGRVTHRIKMRKSTLRRMQLLGVYRDVELQQPSPSSPTPVDKAKEEISGVKSNYKNPEDEDYEIYETYCELDLDEFAPEDFKGKGLPLPYRVTIEKTSRQVLDVRRNWDEDDDQCLSKQYFVQFPFIRGLGFYGLGYLHLLGNTTNALTAAWRETLDAGMFANFPGFIYAKGAGRQLTNQFRVPPGGGIGLDVGAQKSIRDAIMPIPYREAGAGFMGFIKDIEETGRRLGSTANITVGEGKQDAPVGTTLALIEQATKVIDSAHKRLHAAQAEEFKLLKRRFREDPESFWRHNKKPTMEWKKEQFIEALDSCDLVPVADPNNPTSLHRIAKASMIKMMAKENPNLYDQTAVDMRVMRIADIDPSGLFLPSPAPSPPDPRMVAIQEKAKAQENQSNIQLLQTKIKAASEAAKIHDNAQDRESRERLEQMKQELQRLEIIQEQIQHKNDEEKAYARMLHELNQKAELEAQGAKVEALKTGVKLFQETSKVGLEERMAQQRHDAEMQRASEEHTRKMEQAKELHQQKLETIRAQARAKPKPTSKK